MVRKVNDKETNDHPGDELVKEREATAALEEADGDIKSHLERKELSETQSETSSSIRGKCKTSINVSQN